MISCTRSSNGRHSIGGPRSAGGPNPRATSCPPFPPSQAATFVLPPKADSVHSARSFATGTLTGWDLGDLCDGMELVVSELATNALRHGLEIGGRPRREVIRLALIRRGAFVACALTDPGSAHPVLRDPAPFEPGGLGLHIVESISVRWGWSPAGPAGKGRLGRARLRPRRLRGAPVQPGLCGGHPLADESSRHDSQREPETAFGRLRLASWCLWDHC